jgi:hypothetical protein
MNQEALALHQGSLDSDVLSAQTPSVVRRRNGLVQEVRLYRYRCLGSRAYALSLQALLSILAGGQLPKSFGSSRVIGLRVRFPTHTHRDYSRPPNRPKIRLHSSYDQLVRTGHQLAHKAGDISFKSSKVCDIGRSHCTA